MQLFLKASRDKVTKWNKNCSRAIDEMAAVVSSMIFVRLLVCLRAAGRRNFRPLRRARRRLFVAGRRRPGTTAGKSSHFR